MSNDKHRCHSHKTDDLSRQIGMIEMSGQETGSNPTVVSYVQRQHCENVHHNKQHSVLLKQKYFILLCLLPRQCCSCKCSSRRIWRVGGRVWTFNLSPVRSRREGWVLTDHVDGDRRLHRLRQVRVGRLASDPLALGSIWWISYGRNKTESGPTMYKFTSFLVPLNTRMMSVILDEF
jgi:hypothetical protein